MQKKRSNKILYLEYFIICSSVLHIRLENKKCSLFTALNGQNRGVFTEN